MRGCVKCKKKLQLLRGKACHCHVSWVLVLWKGLPIFFLNVVWHSACCAREDRSEKSFSVFGEFHSLLVVERNDLLEDLHIRCFQGRHFGMKFSAAVRCRYFPSNGCTNLDLKDFAEAEMRPSAMYKPPTTIHAQPRKSSMRIVLDFGCLSQRPSTQSI